MKQRRPPRFFLPQPVASLKTRVRYGYVMGPDEPHVAPAPGAQAQPVNRRRYGSDKTEELSE